MTRAAPTREAFATRPDEPMVGAPRLASRAAARAELKKSLDRWLGIPAQWLLHLFDALCGPFRTPRPVHCVRRVVLTKLWGIGNLAMILPYARAVRRAHPRAEIVFLTLERNRALVDRHPCIDAVWTFRERGLLGPLGSMFALVRRMRRQPVDLFLDFEQFLRLSGLMARLGRARQAVGFDTPGQHRVRLHQARVPFDDTRPMHLVFGDVVRAAGVELGELPPLEVPRDEEAAGRVRELLGPRTGERIVLHPGSGDNFPGRRWPAERFAELGLRLARERGATIVLTGTEDERPLLAALAEHLRAQGIEVRELGGRLRLLELIELLARVDLVVSNDTGPVHLAGAVGTPLVALYGPNTPRLYGPCGPNSRAIYHPLPCSPCLTNLNAKSSDCRLPACILSISVDEVQAACDEVRAGARA